MRKPKLTRSEILRERCPKHSRTLYSETAFQSARMLSNCDTPTHKQRMQAALQNLHANPLVFDAIASLIANAYEPKDEQPKNFAELFAFLYFACDTPTILRARRPSVQKLLRELECELV